MKLPYPKPEGDPRLDGYMDWADWIDKNSRVLLDIAMHNQEALLMAWVAETGCMPSESEVVIQHTVDGSRVWVRKRIA